MDDKKDRGSFVSLTLEIFLVFNIGPIFSLILFEFDKMQPGIYIPTWACLTPAILHFVILMLLAFWADCIKKNKKQ